MLKSVLRRCDDVAMLRFFPVIVLIFLAVPALADRRVALIIGNGAYHDAPSLDNPVRDSEAVRGALIRLGFEVTMARDATADQMRTAVRDFAVALEGAELALFFYAGHGIQLNGVNYLIPVDAVVEREADVDLATIPLDLILAQMDRSASTRVVLLDACRNNPFETRLTRTLGQARSASALGRGLATVETRGGTFVGFATDPGEVAFDGADAHSPFTEALLKHIESPGLEINAMMTRVRAEVFAATQRLQRPWSSSSLLQEVYLATPATEDGQADPGASEVASWTQIRDSMDPEDFRRHIARFPDGLFIELAETRLAAMTPEAKADRPLASGLRRPKTRPLRLAPGNDDGAAASAVPAPLPEQGDCPVCPRSLRVEGGGTILGSRDGTPAERPEHHQTIGPFRMAPSEITVGEIQRFESMTGRQIPRGCWVWQSDGRMRYARGAYWGAPGYDVTDASPAACLSWDDARRYVAWLNEQDPSGGWRLPSEAEFEYAARAGSASAYPWPGGAAAVCDFANGADAASIFPWRNTDCEDGARHTATAGTFPANAFGFEHLIGNLWEWTADCWNADHRSAPDDGRARTTGLCASRVLRGGSWDDPVENLRAAYRVGIPADRRQANVGFRPARSAR